MDLTKVLAALQADKLDESAQTDIKEKLTTLIEVKAAEIVSEKVSDAITVEKERLTEELETKFETYKEDITSKFSNFVDSVLEEEVRIPAKVMEFAKYGELYHDLIEQFKLRLAIDEGVLNDEVRGLLKEAKDEILSLKKTVNESTKKTIELEKDAQDMAAHIYLRKKCDGLTEAKKQRVINILGDETIKESIDKKFKVIIESMDPDDDPDDDEDDKKNETEELECPECGTKATVKEDGDTKCPECGAEMKSCNDECKPKKGNKVEEGKGHSEVKSVEKKVITESNSAWSQQMAQWTNLVKRG